ncbi:MAG TPA: patatin-like phospholipase family protein [Bacteroidales bacterium]|nr:patatin-like phospholipase family protein [Bacteroidales bacterium]
MSYKYKLGIALSGGGVKGFAHAGALKAIEEFGIRPEIISGTSAGAIVGAMYASGLPPEKIIEIFRNRYINNFIEFTLPKAGLFGTAGFIKFLDENIPAKTFEELKIPLLVVATDFDHGKSVVFSSGELINKVMASACVPVFFKPITIDGINYVDGGLFMNFPVSVIRKDCEKVIGINVSPLIADKYSKSIIGVVERTYHYIFRANTILEKRLCDVLVEVEEAMQFKVFDLDKVDKIFELGYQVMKSKLEQKTDILKNYLIC